MAIDRADWIRLREAAVEASRSAYCPYSRFRVGASVLTASRRVFAGCNVENASYGLTICAERLAVFQMVTATRNDDPADRTIVAAVVYTPTAAPTAPCGACRQVLNEFGPEAEILCACDADREIVPPRRPATPLSTLLPDAFGPKNLE